MSKATKAEINRALYGRKYSNLPTHGYASKREANVGAALHALASRGKIFEVKEQERILLIPAQKGTLRNEKSVSYVADFTYLDANDGTGHLHVVDAKGAKTTAYILKRKLLRYLKNIEIEEL
jgi:hypothetical protein